MKTPMRPSVSLTAAPAPAKGGGGDRGDGNGGVGGRPGGDRDGSVTRLGADVPWRVD